MTNHLILRADADGRTGTGHLMRCLALVEAWSARGGRATFVTTCGNETLLGRVLDGGHGLVRIERAYPAHDDLATTLRYARTVPEPLVVLDGYGFDAAYQRAVKEAGLRLLVIDDYAHADHYYADLVLNQNLGAEELDYACEPYTRLLLGQRYAVLRDEFAPWRAWRRETATQGQRLLVTLGGTDPDDATRIALDALARPELVGLEALVVIGAGNPHLAALEASTARRNASIRLVSDVTDMAELMAWADVAVSAGGTTCWELAFMGLPNAIMVLADHQALIADRLCAAGVSIVLGRPLELDAGLVAKSLARLLDNAALREKMTCRGRDLVDGHGVGRVVAALEGTDCGRDD